MFEIEFCYDKENNQYQFIFNGKKIIVKKYEWLFLKEVFMLHSEYEKFKKCILED